MCIRDSNWIVYKLCLLVFKCQNKQAPTYLSSLCLPLSAVTTCRQLRAATRGDLDFARTRTVTYGSRAFAVSGPTCWNSLLSYLKSGMLVLGLGLGDEGQVLGLGLEFGLVLGLEISRPRTISRTCKM